MDYSRLYPPSGRFLFKTWGGALLTALFFGTPVYSQPANDECVNATVIPSATPFPPFTDSVDTTTATSNPADPPLSCNGSGAQTDGNTVWYQWTPSSDVTVNISTEGSTTNGGALDTAHGVFTGSCPALTEVACVDIGFTDDLVFEATGGETYFIKFGEFLDGVGGGNLEVSVDLPPPPEQFVIESARDGLSAPISSLFSASAAAAFSARAAGAVSPDDREVPMLTRDDGKAESIEINERAPTQSNAATLGIATSKSLSSAGIQSKARSSIDVLQIFDGVENDDNDALVGGLVVPPDTVGDVGRNHYVQMTNIVTEIFDKNGNSVLGPFPNNVFWTGLGGQCENTNSGDPIVIYDEETDRWLVTQFAIGFQFGLCIAVSQTSDPTGAYYQHEFDFTGIGFPDYPKYGFVTDAIGVMANMFVPFQGAGIGVIQSAAITMR